MLRCVNRRDAGASGEWRIARDVVEAHRARLDESLLGPLDVHQNLVRFTAAPREIVTILVRCTI